MKRLFFTGLFFLLTALACAPSAAWAQAPAADIPVVGSNYFPDTASDLDVAMTYYRLSGQVPDFRKWAAATKEYALQSDFEKVKFLEDKASILSRQYSLLTLQEPLAIVFRANLAPYSPDNAGYVVRNFAEDTFFAFHFDSVNYALVPQGLADHSWLSVNDMIAKDVEAALNNRRDAFMVIYIQPTFADKSAPVDIEGKSYRLISGKVTNISLYKVNADKTAKVLWSENTKEYNEKQTNELLNLKQ